MYVKNKCKLLYVSSLYPPSNVEKYSSNEMNMPVLRRKLALKILLCFPFTFHQHMQPFAGSVEGSVD